MKPWLIYIFIALSMCICTCLHAQSLTWESERITFASQHPAYPGTYDSRASASCSEGVQTPDTMYATIVLPQGGYDSIDQDTGVLFFLSGIGTPDCPADQTTFADDPTNPWSFELQEWMLTKNIVFVQIFYRNMRYMSPYDFGDMQVADVINGVNASLTHFEDQGKPINLRRLYLLGGSGGGHLALQVVQAVPSAFAEVYAGSSITRISTPDDVANHGYTLGTDGDANGSGWIVNAWSLNSSDAASTKTMERTMREPQRHALKAPTFGNRVSKIYVQHGLNDPLVVPQHFWDLRDNVFEYAGVSLEDIDDYQVVGDPDSWVIGNWHFTAVPGGNHSLAGGPTGRNSRFRVVNSVNSECFTSELQFDARLADDYVFPPFDVAGDAYRSTFFFSTENGMRVMNTVALSENQCLLRVVLLGDGDGEVLLSPNNNAGLYQIGDVVTVTHLPAHGSTTPLTPTTYDITISGDTIVQGQFDAPVNSAVSDWASY